MSSISLDAHLGAFEKQRPRLRGVAYRMLGSVADAEDAVQDVFLKWCKMDLSTIDNAEAWLVSACTRRCIDILRGAHKSRVDYVGTWLPEPLVGDVDNDLNDKVELASSLTMAFLVLMERLSPVERATYLLREVFGYAYKDIAFALDRSEAACRQSVRRAHQHLEGQRVAAPPAPRQHNDLLKAFMGALESGDADGFARLLAEDVQLMADGGGKVPAVTKIVQGPGNVTQTMTGIWKAFWSGADMHWTQVNTNPGVVIRADGEIATIVSLEVDEDGKFYRISVVRNPEKLCHLTI